MYNEDRLREMSDDAAFYGRHKADDDSEELGCHEINPLTHWDEVLAANGMTQEEYDRQSDEIVQMQRDDWKRKQLEAEARRIRRETGYWPDWVDEIYE